MTSLPNCPVCGSGYTYEDRNLFVCAGCAHEWDSAESSQDPDPAFNVRDANENLLHEGDRAIVAKDLKVKGSSLVLKMGTKVKINRLVDGDHNIDCKVDGVGAMMLKSEFVKKA